MLVELIGEKGTASYEMSIAANMERFDEMAAIEADRVARLIERDVAAHDRAQRLEADNMRARMKKRPIRVVALDATPERVAMVDSDFINPATVDSSEQRIGRVRRIVSDPLDRLKRAGAITLRQFDAGDWWRNTAQSAGLIHSGRQGYEPSSRGSPTLDFLPRSEMAAWAREDIRQFGAMLSADDRRILDRLCVVGEFSAQGRRGQSSLQLARLALDRLAAALRLPGK